MKELNQGRAAARLRALAVAVALVLALGSPGVQAIGSLPNRLSLTAGSDAVLHFSLPVSASLEGESRVATLNENNGSLRISAGQECGSAEMILRLLGVVPVKKVELEVSEEKILIPGGKSVGIAVETDGLVVVGTSDLGGGKSPALLAGLKAGDVITGVNGVPVRTADELSSRLKAGEEASVTVMRREAEQNLRLTPVQDPRDGRLRIGAWVRSSTAGVGTLTYVDPETGDFGALGHAISDVDTGITLPVAQGGLYESKIVQINPGRKGAPGEIVGDFLTDEHQIGVIEENNDLGVYGSSYTGNAAELPYPDGLPIAARSQVHTGKAQVLTTLDDEIRAFDCEIEHIDPDSDEAMRAIVIRITDEELLRRTGGIVQGMSGSPIIQDGKLVGAVTHVLVNDPTRGYGIFIENMLEAAS